MRISHRYKFILFSNPKTASETLRFCLDKYADVFSEVDHPIYHNHVTPQELKKHFEEMGWPWDEYFKFSFMRNPWDRMVSYYHYFKPNKDYKLVGHNGEWTQQNALPFDEFIDSCANNYEHYYGVKQSNYAWSDQGEYLVDFVGKFESLQDDFIKICKHIGIEEQNLPMINKGCRLAYQAYYTEQSREMLRQISQKEINKFSYIFQPVNLLKRLIHQYSLQKLRNQGLFY